MTTYKIGIDLAEKTVYLALGTDTLPVAAEDLGTFVHDDPSDPVSPHAANHVLFHHIREILYKRSAADPGETASFPDNIIDLANLSIVYHGANAQTTGIYSTRNEIDLVALDDTTFQIKRLNDDELITAGLTVVSGDTDIATVDVAAGTYTVTGVADGETELTVTSSQVPYSLTIPVRVTTA